MHKNELPCARAGRIHRPCRAPRVMTLLIALSLMVPLPGRAAAIDPEADQVLRAMSSYLQGLTAFSLKSEVDSELVNLDGQKLQLSSSSRMLLKRPSHLHSSRKGMFSDVELFFDGETLTLHGNRHDAFVELPVSGTVDDALRAVEMQTGLDFPAADLLFGDPYSVLSEGVNGSHYIGKTYVGDVECHHLAFREDQVDWQLWVQTGDSPRPMKYVITSKWVSGAPQYSVRFSDWNTAPEIAADAFSFSPPAGAKKLESLPINELGELVAPEEVR